MPASNPSSLRAAFENQDEVFSSAFSILRKAIIQKAFPAAAVAITHRGTLIALKALGHFTYDEGTPSLSSRPLRDRACPEQSRSGGEFDLYPPLSDAGCPLLPSLVSNRDFAVNT